ncbi:DJ-1/PfpI family protein [Gloeocapsopsis dulcis]|uniref:Thiamine biosynthesis protein ThiJ n=1 Tax=Gloeocapsopsis dulcis AAB1 = 1H9 TaxID=1433147 RepID=A0A6N8G1I8_9CHRO|nr:DJ-1/PfpI family protein [Gloeocapsopsis dulcis]MUL39071.1 thiamine biosynthesis protein ThiJ [Gloeocapsopsis dulcis AAB1 = 1H9]WNN92132.1 DJ-1/PfpI family protein [Gloeocapsopsis dulcis]
MATASSKLEGKIGVLIESYFDEHEYQRFNQFFPEHGYEVEYVSHLWNQEKLTFKGNDFTEEVTVEVEVKDVNPADYKGIILIGGYAMDRLRYQERPKDGQSNQAPAVAFLVKAANTEGLKIGTICHSLWLFCAEPELLKNRRVTCAHNIICDVENAGGIVMFDGDEAKNTYIDGNLITGRHPGVIEEFMSIFLKEINK